MKNKVLTLLGFAAKAKKLSCGMDMCVSAIRNNKSKLALISFEISPKSQKEINYFADRNSVKVTVLRDCSIEEISKAVGKRCGIISVNDKDFAAALIKEIAEGGNV